LSGAAGFFDDRVFFHDGTSGNSSGVQMTLGR
jgi:hypothetical protein